VPLAVMSAVFTTICNRLGEISRVVGSLEQLAAAQGVPASSIWPVSVALDEVLSNIINYGYADRGEHRIDVRIALEGGQVAVEIEDDGAAFDPLAAPPPVLDGDVTTRPIGKLGIHIVRSLMNEVSYARVGGRNRLLLKRRLARD